MTQSSTQEEAASQNWINGFILALYRKDSSYQL